MYPVVHSIRKTTIQHIQKLQKLYIDSTLRCILEMHSWSLSPTMCHQLLMQLPQLRWLQTESTADITTHDITTMIAKVLGKTWLHGASGFGSQGHLHHWWQCCHQCRWMVDGWSVGWDCLIGVSSYKQQELISNLTNVPYAQKVIQIQSQKQKIHDISYYHSSNVGWSFVQKFCKTVDVKVSEVSSFYFSPFYQKPVRLPAFQVAFVIYAMAPWGATSWELRLYWLMGRRGWDANYAMLQ